MTFNNPEYKNTFVPKQALTPTPPLYNELIGDCMENLAKALAQIPPILHGASIQDNGCGTGAATTAMIDTIPDPPTAQILIKPTDINDQALQIYSKGAAENKWPVQSNKMDSSRLWFPDGTFTHSIGNAFLFVLLDDGIAADAEAGRNCNIQFRAYMPNMDPIQIATKTTRPTGSPLPRQGMEKWTQAEHLRSVIEEGGFEEDKIRMAKGEVYVATCEFTRYATMLWSFIGGTSASGWLNSDEENWDKALDIVKGELLKTDGYKVLDGGKVQLKFVAKVAIATK